MPKQPTAEAAHVARARRAIVLGVCILCACTCVWVLFRPDPASAATSSTINFQARLETASGAIVPDGNYNVEFKLYNSSTVTGTPDQGACTYNGGTVDPSCLWVEDHTYNSGPGATDARIRVANGYLTVNLGSITAFGSINWNQQLWLTMRIGGVSGSSTTWDGEMNPRLQLTAVPYAFQAGTLSATSGTNAGTLNFGTISGTDTITLPDATGTVCLQNASACGFAPAAGGGGYIQLQATTPGTTQTGNFNISGTGILSTLQSATGTSGTTLTVQAGAATSGTNTGGTLLLQGGAGASTGASGSVIIKANIHDTTSAFQVQNAAGNVLLNVDTTNAVVSVKQPSGGQVIFSATAPGTVINDPMTTSVSGALLGSATWVSGQYVQENNGANQNGEVEYTPTLSDFDATFQFNMTGSDGQYIYAFCTTTPGLLACGGYIAEYNSANNVIELFYNGTLLASVSQSGFNNGAWHNAEWVKSGTNFKVYLDGSLMINYTDVARSLTSTKFGLGGFSGGVSGVHEVRSLVVSSGVSNILMSGNVSVTGNTTQTGNVTQTGQLYVAPTLASQVVATLAGASGQSGDLLDLSNSAPTVLAHFDSSANLYAPSLDAQATTLSIGTTNATTINIGTNAVAHAIAIGNGAAAQAITVGSTSTTSSLLLQAGSGGIKVSPLAAKTSASAAVCRDTSTNILTACDSTNTSGAAFLQGGNTFGAQGVLGTNDNNSLAIRTNGTNRVILDTSGNLTFQQASVVSVASAATGTPFTIQAGAATTSGNNGGNLFLQGGAGSGTGTTGSVIVKANTTDSASAFQVQNAAALSIVNVDTTNQTLTVRAGSDHVNQSANLYSGNFSSGWTATGWNVSGVTTAIHTTGNTSALVNTSVSIAAGATYEVSFTISGACGPTSDSVVATIGGAFLHRAYGNECAGATAYIATAGTTAGLTFTPTTNWAGTISAISIYQITGSIQPVLKFLNSSSGSPYLEMRANSDQATTYIGVQSGQYDLGNAGESTALGADALQFNMSSHGNVAVGAYALQYNISGSQQVAVGYAALKSNTTGSNNLGIGYDALQNNTTGGGNIAIGTQSLLQNTTGSNNLALGYAAGYQDSGNTFQTLAALQNATAIGAYAQVQASNSIVLGSVDTATNVGIGVTVPSNTFSVSPLDYQTGTVTRTNGSATLIGTGTTWTSAMVGDLIVFADGTTNTVSAFTDATHVTMSATYTGTTDSSPVSYRFHHVGLQVTSGGNVGIGTTSPSQTLQISTNSNSSTGIHVENDNTGASAWSQLELASSTQQYNIGLAGPGAALAGMLGIYDQTNHAFRLAVTSGGNVGIATSSPQFTLDVAGTGRFKTGTNSTTAFQVQNASGTSVLVIDTTNSQATVNGNLVVNAPSGYSGNLALLQLNGSSRFAIDATGHIIAGGSVPTAGTISNCGTSPSLAITSGSTDARGSVTLTVGSGSPTASCAAVVTFANAYASTPFVVVSSDSARVAVPVVTATSTSSFTIGFNSTAPLASTAYVISYIAIQ